MLMVSPVPEDHAKLGSIAIPKPDEMLMTQLFQGREYLWQTATKLLSYVDRRRYLLFPEFANGSARWTTVPVPSRRGIVFSGVAVPLLLPRTVEQ